MLSHNEYVCSDIRRPNTVLVVSTKYKTDSLQSLQPYRFLTLHGTFDHRVIPLEWLLPGLDT